MTSNWRDAALGTAGSTEVAKFNATHPCCTLLLIPNTQQRAKELGCMDYGSVSNTTDPQRLTGWDKIQIQQRRTLDRCQFSAPTAVSTPLTSRLWPRGRMTPEAMGTEVPGGSTLLKVCITHGCAAGLPSQHLGNWSRPTKHGLGSIGSLYLNAHLPVSCFQVNKCFQSICFSKNVPAVCGSHYQILNGTAARGPSNCNRKFPFPSPLKALWLYSFLCLISSCPNLLGRSRLSQSTLCWEVLCAHLEAIRA